MLPGEVACNPWLSAMLGFQHTADRKAGHSDHHLPTQMELQTHKADKGVKEYHTEGRKTQWYLPVSYVHSSHSALFSSLFVLLSPANSEITCKNSINSSPTQMREQICIEREIHLLSDFEMS